MTPEYFDLVAAKLQEAKSVHIRLLNEAIFAPLPVVPLTPLTRRERWRRRVTRAQRYLSTLWDALRGRDPYDVDYDY